MSVLKTIMQENELADFKKTILELHKTWTAACKKFKTLNEGVTDFETDDLGYMFEEARKRFLAAKNAVKIANKLNDPAQKSRVFSNLNQLRALVNRLTKTIQVDLEKMEQSLKPNQMFDQRPVDRSNTQFGRNQGQQQAPQRQAPPQQQQAPQGQ